MKKAALTFGLFSLIMVATSFATPEKKNKSIAGNIDIMIGVDGNGTRDGRHKVDVAGIGTKSDINYSSLKNFDTDRQSRRIDVKVD
ncbi:hypothetical protein [uncultured Flavobacterium sp.]|uniref:hypothetical protein n=1 Tax=uncultured Flavobacterium sp. TaxID=165435 RepID=UPI00292D23E5|nr:hypothetical protein [uncultured Flavobacterium sp.]